MAASILGGGTGGDKGLRLKLADTIRLAWADEDLRRRLLFILTIFAVYSIGVHVPVPVPGIDPSRMESLLAKNSFFSLMNTLGGGAFRRISIFALGLGPYISSSIILQILTYAFPQWKEELKEGGEYARKKQNQRTRFMMLGLCLFQGFGMIKLMSSAMETALSPLAIGSIILFWTAGSMFLLWMGELLTERGIGNGISLLIFVGICNGVPNVIDIVRKALENGTIHWYQALAVLALYAATTWLVVYFTIAQRRIPIEHMRRNFGTKSVGGQTSYLPFAVNLAGVMPIIFALSLLSLPRMLTGSMPPASAAAQWVGNLEKFLYPDFTKWQGWIGAVLYTFMIFFFTFFMITLQYNVEDIADNLKRGGSFIRGIRPGKQTRDFLDKVLTRITFVGAGFLALVALTQFILPLIAPIQNLGLIGGTSLLIMVSVALETMRQIEATLISKQYES